MNHRHVHTNEILVVCMFWWSSVFWFTYKGVLQHPDGTILKQLQPPPRGPREMLFYTQVTDFHFELCKSCKCLVSDPKRSELRHMSLFCRCMIKTPKTRGCWTCNIIFPSSMAHGHHGGPHTVRFKATQSYSNSELDRSYEFVQSHSYVFVK